MKAKITLVRNGGIIDAFEVEVNVLSNIYTITFPVANVFEADDTMTIEYIGEEK